MTKSLPLRLSDLFFPTICVKAQSAGENEKVASHYEDKDIEVSFTFTMSEDGTRAHASFTLETKPSAPETLAPLPYELEVQVVAGFDILLPEHTDDRALWMRKNAAAAALIGATREQIAMTTARGPWGTALMPMISISQLLGPIPKAPEVEALPVPQAGKRPPPAKRSLPAKSK